MKAIHRLAHAKEPAAKIRRDKEPVECRACGETAMREEWRDNLYICPHCGNHRGMTPHRGFASPRIPEASGIRPQHSRRQSAGFSRIYREDSGDAG